MENAAPLKSESKEENEIEYKIFNDSVHGCIELHPLCVKIIDTPQFQRLRFIKQLGLAYFVYPGASHNRFEHSIGTCHLAGLMVQNIRQRQPELGITDKDILCVQIAGLCHDLGHGSFSHVYEHFIKCASPGSKWKHEEASLKMFDYLYKENEKVKQGFRDENKEVQNEIEKMKEVEKDKEFIKNLIHPFDKLTDNFEKTGRGEDKGFLYQIISAQKNGIDVDKWDYFARDCHHLGIKNNFDHLRLMKFARVIKNKDGRNIIAYRDKVAEDIYNMFHLRRSLHKNAYQHKVVNCISKMFVDALMDAKDHIKRTGSDGKEKGLVESINDMQAYSQLTDTIFEEILYSTSSKLKKSRGLLERIINRQLYSFIGEFHRSGDQPTNQSIAGDDKIIECIAGDDKEIKDQLVICKTVLDYGLKSENPVDEAFFYSKKSPDDPIPIPSNKVSHMLPTTFSETFVQVFVKRESFIKRAKTAFKNWEQNGK